MALLQLATPSSPTSHSYGSALADVANPILSVRHQEERVGRTLQEPRTRLGSKERCRQRPTTFAPWQMGSQSHTASMISRVIEAPCMSERLTTRRQFRSRNASRSGGALKVRSVFPGRKHLLVVADTGGSKRRKPAVHGKTRHPAQAVQRARFGRHGRTLSTRCVQVETQSSTACFSEISKNWGGPAAR